MPRAKISFDTVREVALALPDVEDGTTFGKPALKVKGKLLACVPSHKSAEPESLVVRIDFEQRAALLAEAPDTYYVTGHYTDYPAVLVRLPLISRGQLDDLLRASWRFVTSERRTTRSRRARTT